MQQIPDYWKENAETEANVILFQRQLFRIELHAAQAKY